MKRRLWFAAALLLIALAVWELLTSADDDAGVTLAELTSADQSATTSILNYLSFDRRPDDDATALAGVKIESLFYGVLGVCGALLALRIFISALRTLKEERPGSDIASPPRRLDRRTAPAFAMEQGDLDELGNDRAETAGESAAARRHRHFSLYPCGLTVRMIGTFTGLVAFFGLLVLALVYFTLTASLSKHIIERARVMAFNVSDGAPGYLLKNNAPGLREILRKHAHRPELAYIVVQDRSGEIFTHSFPVLPEEIRNSALPGSNRGDAYRTLQLGGGVVEEVAVPIMEGRRGYVRLGIWRDQVDAEVEAAVMPLVKILLAVVGCAIVLAVVLAWRINRPIFKLVSAAKAISAGDLDAPAVRIEDATEFNELSRALERMRSSVKAAMTRLGR